GVLARIACKAARCTSSPWIENFTMLRFILSHASTDLRSLIRFSTSCGSKVGIAMPGSGTPRLPHRRRYISKGSSGGGVFWSAMAFGQFGTEEFAQFGFAADGVLVAEVDQRAAEALLEQEIAREVRARARERAGLLQDEA